MKHLLIELTDAEQEVCEMALISENDIERINDILEENIFKLISELSGDNFVIYIDVYEFDGYIRTNVKSYGYIDCECIDRKPRIALNDYAIQEDNIWRIKDHENFVKRIDMKLILWD